LAFGYNKIAGNAATAANGAGRPATPGGFYFGEFTPDLLLKLNDWTFLQAEIAVGSDGSVSAGSFLLTVLDIGVGGGRVENLATVAVSRAQVPER
jgi:hypothetical protein